MCGTRLAKNTGRKNDAKNRHLCSIAQLCWVISSELRQALPIGKKRVKQQYLLHMQISSTMKLTSNLKPSGTSMQRDTVKVLATALVELLNDLLLMPVCKPHCPIRSWCHTICTALESQRLKASFFSGFQRMMLLKDTQKSCHFMNATALS